VKVARSVPALWAGAGSFGCNPMKDKKYELTDKQINKSFEGTNFGGADRRTLLAMGVLKRVAGYKDGSTLTAIMKELELTTGLDNPTMKGKRFCCDFFYRRCGRG
jgi:hypothetical protein